MEKNDLLELFENTHLTEADEALAQKNVREAADKFQKRACAEKEETQEPT